MEIDEIESKKKNKNGEKKERQNRKRKERKQTEAKADCSFSRADHVVNRGAIDSILYPIDGIISIVMAVDKRK